MYKLIVVVLAVAAMAYADTTVVKNLPAVPASTFVSGYAAAPAAPGVYPHYPLVYPYQANNGYYYPQGYQYQNYYPAMGYSQYAHTPYYGNQYVYPKTVVQPAVVQPSYVAA